MSINNALLNEMLDFTQYVASVASTSTYEGDIIDAIKKLQPQIKDAIAHDNLMATTHNVSATPQPHADEAAKGGEWRGVLAAKITALEVPNTFTVDTNKLAFNTGVHDTRAAVLNLVRGAL
jgi:hypothetical protein